GERARSGDAASAGAVIDLTVPGGYQRTQFETHSSLLFYQQEIQYRGFYSIDSKQFIVIANLCFSIDSHQTYSHDICGSKRYGVLAILEESSGSEMRSRGARGGNTPVSRGVTEDRAICKGRLL